MENKKKRNVARWNRKKYNPDVSRCVELGDFDSEKFAKNKTNQRESASWGTKCENVYIQIYMNHFPW